MPQLHQRKPQCVISLALCTVTSTNPLQGGIGQIDDLAVWSRALPPDEVFRTHSDGVEASSKDLSLFYNFNEGVGPTARNKGQAGPKYDLALGRATGGCGGGPISFGSANKLGGFDEYPFTPPQWASADPELSVAATPRPAGFGPGYNQTLDKPFTIELKEGSPISFILEYVHPTGRKSGVRITRLPTHGSLTQAQAVGTETNTEAILTAPYDVSPDPYSWLVRRSSRVAAIRALCWLTRVLDSSCATTGLHP